MAATFVIDGANFVDLDGFYAEVCRVLIPGQPPVRNLDAFNDILCWPALDAGSAYTLVWRNSAASRDRLGHEQLTRKLEQMAHGCHPSNVPDVARRLKQARQGTGPTLFDWLCDIIRENQEYVSLRLE